MKIKEYAILAAFVAITFTICFKATFFLSDLIVSFAY